MTTPRASIRQAVQQTLLGSDDDAAPTGVGRKVYASRSTPIPPKMLPVALVYTQDERRDREAGGGVIRRELEVVVEIAAQGDDADDQIDLLAAQVEGVLEASPTLGGAVESLTWDSTETDYDGEGTQPAAAARLTFTAAYSTVPAEDVDDMPLPGGVYASWAPNIGLPHEEDYVTLSETQMPDLIDGS